MPPDQPDDKLDLLEEDLPPAVPPVETPQVGTFRSRRDGSTHTIKDMKRQQAAGGVSEEPEDAYTREMRSKRPKTRGDCKDGVRPCPWVSCRFHLYLEVNNNTGSMFTPFAEKEPWELAETCSLDVGDQDEHTLEQVAELIGVTRERIRQIQDRALVKLRTGGQVSRELIEDDW